MMTWLRRVFLISVLSGGGYAAWSLYQRRQLEPAAPPEWPPIDPPATTSGESAASETAAGESGSSESIAGESTDSGWVEPGADGSCPLSHPVKANANSGIFHVPEGRSYARTKAERCYADPAAATADGFRAAKA